MTRVYVVVFLYLVAIAYATTQVHNYATTLVNNAYYIDSFSGVIDTSCGALVVKTDATCTGTDGLVTESGSVVGSVLFNGTTNAIVDAKMSVLVYDDPTGQRVDVSVGSGSFMISGDASIYSSKGSAMLQYDGADNSTCLTYGSGSGLGGIDLTLSGTQNAYVFYISSSDAASIVDITTYNTTGSYERLVYGAQPTSGGTPYLVTAPQELYVKFGDPYIYGAVDAIEMRFYSNPYVSDNDSWDMAMTEITVGSATGCDFTDNMARYEQPFTALPCELTPVESRDPLCVEQISNFYLYETPQTLQTHNYRPLPYGNTFSYFITGTPGVDTQNWRRYSAYLRHVIVDTTTILDVLVLDFANTTGDGLFRTFSIDTEMSLLTNPTCSGSAVFGAELTFLGSDLSTPLAAPVTVSYGVGSSPFSTTTTFDAGSNILRGVAIDLSAAVCGGTSFIGFYDITQIQVTADGNCDRETPITVPACRDVEGVAWFDDNGNQIIDPGESYVAEGTLVTLTSNSQQKITFTGSQGDYIFSCSDVGDEVTVIVQQPVGTVVTTNNNPQTISPTDVCNNTVQQVGFAYGNGVAGRIYQDLNADGMQTGTEPGFAGVTVTLQSGNGTLYTNVTDQFGNFLIDPVIVGNYTLDIVGFPQLGYTQTQGMDPDFPTVTYMPNNTIVGPYGFHFQVPCDASATTVLDDFTATVSPMMVATYPYNRSATIVQGIRTVTLETYYAPWQSMWCSGAMYSSVGRTQATICYAYENEDMTSIRNNAISLDMEALTNFSTITLTVTNIYGESETQQHHTNTANQTIARFYYLNSTIYQNVSSLCIVIDTRDQPTLRGENQIMLTTLYRECATCETLSDELTFAENENKTFIGPFRQVYFNVSGECVAVAVNDDTPTTVTGGAYEVDRIVNAIESITIASTCDSTITNLQLIADSPCSIERDAVVLVNWPIFRVSPWIWLTSVLSMLILTSCCCCACCCCWKRRKKRARRKRYIARSTITTHYL